MADIFVRDANLVSLMEKTGYTITQEYGQRRFGPPPGWTGPPPPKGSEIFIGKLPRDVYEDELVPLCEQFGKIYELRLMTDFNGENRGYSFVTYTNNHDASKAIRYLDGFQIRFGRHIVVYNSIVHCRLFIGGICKNKSKEEIMAEISKYTEGVSKVLLCSTTAEKFKNTGFAFFEYESQKFAAIAKRKLLASKIKLFGHPIFVDWARPEAPVEDEKIVIPRIQPPPPPPAFVLNYLYRNEIVQNSLRLHRQEFYHDLVEKQVRNREEREQDDISKLRATSRQRVMQKKAIYNKPVNEHQQRLKPQISDERTTIKAIDIDDWTPMTQQSDAYDEETFVQSMPIFLDSSGRQSKMSGSSSSSSLLSTKWKYSSYKWIKKSNTERYDRKFESRRMNEFNTPAVTDYFPSSCSFSSLESAQIVEEGTDSRDVSSPLKKILEMAVCVTCGKKQLKYPGLKFTNLECFHSACRPCSNMLFGRTSSLPVTCPKCLQVIRRMKNRDIDMTSMIRR